MGHAYGVKNWSKGHAPSVPSPPLTKPEPWVSESKLLTRKQASAKTAKRRKAKAKSLAAAKSARAAAMANASKPKAVKKREKKNPL